jgi:hypothetical protein
MPRPVRFTRFGQTGSDPPPGKSLYQLKMGWLATSEAALERLSAAVAAAAALTAAVAASVAAVAAFIAAIAAFMASMSRFIALKNSIRDARRRIGHIPATFQATFTSLSFIIRYETQPTIVTTCSQVIHIFANLVKSFFASFLGRNFSGFRVPARASPAYLFPATNAATKGR